MIAPRPMRRACLPLLVAAALLSAPVATAQGPVRVVFDTDLAADVDDVGALAVLHALADRGEVEILATLVSSRNRHSVACLSALNTWYGRRDIPIGSVRGQVAGYPKDTGGEVESKYTEEIARKFPRELRSAKDAPDAAAVYRRALAGQPDGRRRDRDRGLSHEPPEPPRFASRRREPAPRRRARPAEGPRLGLHGGEVSRTGSSPTGAASTTSDWTRSHPSVRSTTGRRRSCSAASRSGRRSRPADAWPSSRRRAR